MQCYFHPVVLADGEKGWLCQRWRPRLFAQESQNITSPSLFSFPLGIWQTTSTWHANDKQDFFPSRYVRVQNSLLFEAFDKSLHTESAKTLLKNCCLKKSKCCLCETARSVGRGTWEIWYYFRLECYFSSLILSTCYLIMGYNAGLDWLHKITWKKEFVSFYL